MGKIAIDVVILPPEEIMDFAIGLNEPLVDDPIKLNKQYCLPHITLCMGAVDEEKLPTINSILDDIATEHPSLPLTISGIRQQHASLDIIRTDGLQNLHETIMKRISPYLSYDATVDMCFSPPVVVERTLFWINNFKENSSFEKYYPHITLGISKFDDKELDVRFVGARLGICHLGNYCTCRKVLHAVELKNE